MMRCTEITSSAYSRDSNAWIHQRGRGTGKAATDKRWSAKGFPLQFYGCPSRVYYPAAAAGTEPNLLSLEWNSFTAFCRSVALKSGQRRSVKYSSA